MSKRYASIPVPTMTLEGLYQTVHALKTTVDELAGLSGHVGSPTGSTHNDYGASHVFVTNDLPVLPHVGDIWIKPYPDSAARYWNGNEWAKFTVT